MNSDLSKQCQCYGLYDKDKIIGFIGILHQPSTNKKIKRVSRLVILPDYQGIGLGTKFLTSIAKIYVKQGYDFSIVTSAKNLISSLAKNKDWICIRYNKQKENQNNDKWITRKVITGSFFYKK